MAIELEHGYPEAALVSQYVPAANSGIEEGHFVSLNGSYELVKSPGGADQDSWIALNNHPRDVVDNGGKVAVAKRNAIFWTDKFLADSYTPQQALEVSTVVSEAGLLRAKTTGKTVARFLEQGTLDGIEMVKVQLEG